MSSQLKLDKSKEVFKLDKEFLSFKINLESLPEQEPIKSPIESENEIKITNLTDDYLAFRTKTTKRLYYNVSPAYCIIPPKETKTITISFSLKEGEIPKLIGHKFKFEAFIIPENEKDKDPKDLFNDYAIKGESVVGNSQKTFVQFINGEDKRIENESNTQDKNHLQLPNQISHIRSGSDLSEYLDIEENNGEKKVTLMDQIKSNEGQKPILSEIISGGISEIKKEEKIEDVNNITKLEEKIEEIKEKIVNKIDDIPNINEKNEEIKERLIDKTLNKKETTEEKINNCFGCDILGNFRKEHPDIITYIALFIVMLIGYNLVK